MTNEKVAIKSLPFSKENDPAFIQIQLLNGATNGDMIQAMFPNGDLHDYDYYDGYVIYELNYMDMKFDKDWWYAPYKRGGK